MAATFIRGTGGDPHSRGSSAASRQASPALVLSSQAEIATQAGFTSANMMSMLKSGAIRLPLDRVQPLATALEVDPSFLMLLTLEQMVGDTDAEAIVEILSGAVTRNEMSWIETHHPDHLRDAAEKMGRARR